MTLKTPENPSLHRRYVADVTNPFGPELLPVVKPPYGRITAIDLNTGEHVWQVPHGSGPRDHPLLKDLDLPPLGWPRRGHVLVTKTLLIAFQEGAVARFDISESGNAFQLYQTTSEAMLRAFDKDTGALVAEVELPQNATAAPMTYMAHNKQYILVSTGGSDLPSEIISLSLP